MVLTRTLGRKSKPGTPPGCFCASQAAIREVCNLQRFNASCKGSNPIGGQAAAARRVLGSGTPLAIGWKTDHSERLKLMTALILIPMFAAAGYSLLYLLFGGGIGGAILIFIVAKMLGK